MYIPIPEIKTENDIITALPFIKENLAEKDKNRLPHIKIELEIELGFLHQDHLLTNESLDDFPPLQEKRIAQIVLKTLKTNPIRYPKPNLIKQKPETEEPKRIADVKQTNGRKKALSKVQKTL